MKSNIRKRIIAFMLCMVMVISCGTSAMADETGANLTENAEAAAKSQAVEEPAQQEVVEEEPAQQVIEEEPKQQVGEEEPQEEPQEENTQPSEGAAVPYEKLYEDEKVTIKVNAEAGIVPENAELSVTPIVKKDITDSMTAEEKAETEAINDEYDFTSEKLAEDSDKKNEIMEGFLAYDISFMVDGEEIAPSGTVDVVMEFKEAVAPEGISEEATVSVKHLKENENEVVVEDLSDKAEVHTTDKVEVQKVEMKSDSFSIFTLAWGTKATLPESTTEEVRRGGPTKVQTISDIEGVKEDINMKMIYYWPGTGAIPFTGAEWIDNPAGRGVKSGILNNVLGKDEDGKYTYPTFNTNNEHGVKETGSLENFYGKNAVEVDANSLFLRQKYLEKGRYYYYNSGENAAVLNTAVLNTENKKGRFDVYKELITPRDTDNQNAFFYQRGNFLPYDTINSMKKAEKSKNLFDAEGNKLDPVPSDPTLYLPDDGDPSYHFGMELAASFFQTKDGIFDGQHMRYEFTGDDDLWVYIDGVLVLDMGGCHDARSGYIDFSTGEVFVQGIGKTLIYEHFQNAGKTGEVEWNKDKTTFADFTNHDIKMWYMERGGGASNLKIKFNLPIIEKKAINVMKVVEGEDGTALDYAQDIDFHFNIKVDQQNYANKDYEILNNGVPSGRYGKTDADGNFVLRHLQTAKFSDISEDQKYQVTETGAYISGYKVKVDGTILTTTDSAGENGTTISSVTTPELQVGNRPHVVFKNTVLDTATLSINKVLKSGSGEALKNKIFPVILKINGEVYENAYHINGRTQTATDGIINLKANETATITGLPYGATVEVEEQMDGSYLPTYSVGEMIYDIVKPEYDADGILINGVTTISGKVAGDCNVTIENEAIKMGTGTTSVTVKKTWQDSEEYAGLIPKSLKVTLYEDVNHNQEFDEGTDVIPTYVTPTVQLTLENEWTYTWSNLPGDKDFVVVEECPEGFKQLETTIENDITSVDQIEDKTSTNSIQKFGLGKNNLLLVKTTQGEEYFLWSPIDLRLTVSEMEEVKQKILAIGLTGAGSLKTKNLTYQYGAIPGGDIKLSETETGWLLEFRTTDTWALFWTYSYARNEKVTLTNTIDKDQKIAIDVNKVWGGDTLDTRPKNITIQLYEKLNEDSILEEAVIQPDSDGNWKHQFVNLPKYGRDSNGNYYTIEYEVKETKIGGDTVDKNGCAANYQSSVNKNEDGSFTITNTRQWQIIKISANSTEADKLVLAGAVFRLARQGEVSLDTNIWGKSDENGIVKWYDGQGCTTEIEKPIPDGTYELSEITSPQGYMVSEETWTVEILGGAPTEVEAYKDAQHTVLESEMVDGKNTYYYENEIVYSLPSTGGTGIYWYIIGGMLLMIAAALILYKSKGGEVLKR